MVSFLQSLPVWAMALVVTGLALALGAACLWSVKTLLPAPRRGPVNEVAGFILAVAGVLYAVPLALITLEAWDDYSAARDAVQQEAAQVARAATLSSSLPGPVRIELLAGLAAYTRAVINEEWPTMARGETPLTAERHLLALRDFLDGEAESAPAPDRRLERAIEHIDELLHTRIDRLLAVHQALIAPVWWLIAAGAALILFFCAIFAVEDRTLHNLLCALVAAIIALIVILIVATDRPFYGNPRISPEPFQHVLEHRLGAAGAQPR